MIGILERNPCNFGDTLIGKRALEGALKRIQGSGFSFPLSDGCFKHVDVDCYNDSDCYDDSPYGDEYGDAPDDYQDNDPGNDDGF